MDIKVMTSMIMAAIAIIAFAASAIVWFVKLPSANKLANLSEWLKYAVIEAEKTLGSGTGQLKLRLVYDMAIKNFPWVATTMNFETFSKLVDIALEWMKEQLAQNVATQTYVKM